LTQANTPETVLTFSMTLNNNPKIENALGEKRFSGPRTNRDFELPVFFTVADGLLLKINLKTARLNTIQVYYSVVHFGKNIDEYAYNDDFRKNEAAIIKFKMPILNGVEYIVEFDINREKLNDSNPEYPHCEVKVKKAIHTT